MHQKHILLALTLIAANIFTINSAKCEETEVYDAEAEKQQELIEKDELTKKGINPKNNPGNRPGPINFEFKGPEDFDTMKWEEFPIPMRNKMISLFGRNTPGTLAPHEEVEARKFLKREYIEFRDTLPKIVRKYDKDKKGYLTEEESKEFQKDPELIELQQKRAEALKEIQKKQMIGSHPRQELEKAIQRGKNNVNSPSIDAEDSQR